MIACLRMLLAYRGMEVSEAALLQDIASIEGGVDPEQLAQLAHRYDLHAGARQLDLPEMMTLVASQRFPIVLIDRSFIDGEFAIHAVIPIRFSRHYIRLLDPLRGERRVSIRKFSLAQRRVGRWAVVWD
jgi:ABC-type bacteriocin/lantibiotic exporter with double-glycine peptidase domain